MLNLALAALAGLVVGWFVLPRPAWAVNLWTKLTGKTPLPPPAA